MNIKKRIQSLVALCMVSLIGFYACGDDEQSSLLLCRFLTQSSFGSEAFDKCTALFSPGVGQFFIDAENDKAAISLGGWEKTLNEQVKDANSNQDATAFYTDKASGQTLVATGGKLQFTEIDEDNGLLSGNFDFEVTIQDSTDSNVEGTFENVPFTED